MGVGLRWALHRVSEADTERPWPMRTRLLLLVWALAATSTARHRRSPEVRP